MIVPTIDQECKSVSPGNFMSFFRRKTISCCSDTHPPYVVDCKSETYLPVPIPECGEVKLEECVNGEERSEMISDHECTVCGNMGTKSAMHLTSISKFFNVYVKRILYSSNNQAKKLKTKVTFCSRLNLQIPEQDEENSEHIFIYNLIGFIMHIGDNPTSGHYVAIVKTGNEWELHDDKYICTLDEEMVFSGHSFENVYLLIFCRLDFQNELA